MSRPKQRDDPFTHAAIAAFARTHRLSPRETELLGILLEGVDSNQDLAARLDVTVSTAKSMLTRIYLRTGTASKSNLILACLRHYFQTEKQQ